MSSGADFAATYGVMISEEIALVLIDVVFPLTRDGFRAAESIKKVPVNIVKGLLEQTNWQYLSFGLGPRTNIGACRPSVEIDEPSVENIHSADHYRGERRR